MRIVHTCVPGTWFGVPSTPLMESLTTACSVVRIYVANNSYNAQVPIEEEQGLLLISIGL